MAIVLASVWSGTFPREAFEGPGDVQPRPHDNCYWLLPGRFLAGEYPGQVDPQRQVARLTALLEAGVRQGLDLTDPAESLPPYAPSMREIARTRGVELGIERIAIADFGVPAPATMRHILDTLAAALGRRDTVYLHCHGGIGRTGTVVGCLLVEAGYTPMQALGLIEHKWQVMAKRARAPVSPETDAQRAYIARWADPLLRSPLRSAPEGPPPGPA